MQKKMYVLVRNEFAPGYVVAQSNHATNKFALEHPELHKEWGNSTIVALGVWYPQGIEKWKEILSLNGKSHSVYCEDDQEGQPTALACYDTGDIFKDLRLYR